MITKKNILRTLAVAALLVYATVRPAPAARLPGQYAIGNIGYYYFWTAREGGRHTIDGVVTNARSVGPYEKFSIETMNPNYKLLITANNYYVSAAAGGGLGANYGAGQVIQAARTGLADDALFRLESSDPGFSPYTIRTFRNYYVTALGGGGRHTAPFYTDAIKRNSYWEDFTLHKCGDLGSGQSYAIMAAGSGGGYPLQALKGGGQVKSGVEFFLQKLGGGAQRFRPIRQNDGSYALQTANGVNYVTAIGGGGHARNLKDSSVLVANRTQVQGWEKFRIVDRGDCTYTIQTVDNWYVGFSAGRGLSTRISYPSAAPSIGYTAYFRFIPFL